VYKQVAEKAYILYTQQQDSITQTLWNIDLAKDTRVTKEDLDTIDTNKLPNLTGWSIDKALYVLENEGIEVKRSGFGLVQTQSVKSGTPIDQISSITLTCQEP
jgi:hypothetical protein